MSNGKKAFKEEKPASAPATAVKKATEIPLDTLRKDSVTLFGVTTSTFDGAMDGQEGPFTIAKAKEIIETWKRGVVK